ncbi:Gfo/Idh/MocA family protein [Mariniphaga sediminis]|uniref:Gfo/Idh/MocA family protein n=1 Tax=Mariniphaga sediminis TaxID=1628158 RepID=UPI00356B31EF
MTQRRDFLRTSVTAGAGLSLFPAFSATYNHVDAEEGRRVGIIGLDTSHCKAFTKVFNNTLDNEYGGYKVVAAYPTSGSSDLPASINRIEGFTDWVKQQGVEILGSIEELLEKVDVVLLETVDGRKHLEQALPVLKAGKRLFIDKPMAASLSDGIAIFSAAKQNNVPVFSTSSVRYIIGMDEVKNGSVGKITGADTFSPAFFDGTHPDLFWYGIHGVEMLFSVMGAGCKSVTRISTSDTDIVVGIWADGRVGTFRGTRSGKPDIGGTVFGEKGTRILGPDEGYELLLKEIARFFETGVTPVKPEETLEVLAFMEAADESKKREGVSVSIQEVMEKA